MPQTSAPLVSPVQKRSQYLAEALKNLQAGPGTISSYGQLGAELLAQGITKWKSDRADKAASVESEAKKQERLSNMASVLGLGEPQAPSSPAQGLSQALVPPSPIAPEGPGNTLAPVQSPTAPIAPIQGGDLPPVGQMPTPASPQAPAVPVAPQAAPATSAVQQAIFQLAPNERAYVQQLIANGDEAGLAAVVEAVRGRNLSPNIQVGPDGTTYNADDPNALNRTFAKRENINGFVTDVNNPENEGRYLPDLQPGERPLYDDRGNIVGVMNLDGAVQALGQRTRAVSDAQNASEASYAGAIAGAEAGARAPYQFVNVQGPQGQPITMSASQAAGGVFEGRSSEGTVEAESMARNRAAAIEAARARASAATRVLPSLDEMEKRLPDVISGFGAGARGAVSGALAALPLGPLNDQAQRESTATQTFQNEARQVVSGILPLFGANPTEGERNYAERMSGADVTLTPEALQEGINLARQRAARETAAYEAMLSGGSGAQTGQRLTPEQASRLPPGTRFTGMDGVERTVR